MNSAPAHLIITTHTTRHLEAVLKGASQLTPLPETISVTCDVDEPEIEVLVKSCAERFNIPIYYTARKSHSASRQAQTRNNAVRALIKNGYSTGQLIFIDGDMILEPNAVQDHLERSQKFNLIAGERYNLSEPDTLEFQQKLFENKITEFDQCPDELNRLVNVDKNRRTHAILRRFGLTKPGKPKLISCHFSIRFPDFITLNGFDERYTGWGGEDDDLGRRCHKLGLRYCPAASTILSYHLYHPTRSTGSWKDNPGVKIYSNEPWTPCCKLGLNTPAPQNDARTVLFSNP